MARYRLIDPAYDHGFLGDVLLRSTIVDGSYMGVAEVDELPANLPRRVRVEEIEPEQQASDLESLTVPALRDMAAELGIETRGLRKAELIDAINVARE